MVNSSSCMQIPANMLRIYPVEALPSMKTHCIVLFKNPLAVHVAQRQGGGIRRGWWPHTALDSLISSEILPPFLFFPSSFLPEPWQLGQLPLWLDVCWASFKANGARLWSVVKPPPSFERKQPHVLSVQKPLFPSCLSAEKLDLDLKWSGTSACRDTWSR